MQRVIASSFPCEDGYGFNLETRPTVLYISVLALRIFYLQLMGDQKRKFHEGAGHSI